MCFETMLENLDFVSLGPLSNGMPLSEFLDRKKMSFSDRGRREANCSRFWSADSLLVFAESNVVMKISEDFRTDNDDD